MFKSALISTLMQIIFFFGVISISSITLFGLSRLFFRSVKYNKTVIFITGFFGIIIHELSHIIFAIIFMHRIETFSLFDIDHSSPHGYVTTTYNSKNLWSKIGLYFVGVGPIIIGSLLIFLIINLNFSNILIIDFSVSNISDVIYFFKEIITIFLNHVYKPWNVLSILLIISISLFSALSSQDLVLALKGSIHFFILLFIFNLVFTAINVNIVNVFSDFIITLSMVQSIILVFISFLIIGISILFHFFNILLSLTRRKY